MSPKDRSQLHGNCPSKHDDNLFLSFPESIRQLWKSFIVIDEPFKIHDTWVKGDPLHDRLLGQSWPGKRVDTSCLFYPGPAIHCAWESNDLQQIQDPE